MASPRRFAKTRQRPRTSKIGSWRSLCPPCVGGKHYPNCACTSHGSCPMVHRARNAPCPWRRRTIAHRARQMVIRPVTGTRRETTQTATPVQRPDPGGKKKTTSNIRTTRREKSANSEKPTVNQKNFKEARQWQTRRFQEGFHVRKS